VSEYDNAGRVETWKIGGEWQLPAPILFRTMFQRSVRAPNLYCDNIVGRIVIATLPRPAHR
jgi:outer membrane cobalamin receptor